MSARWSRCTYVMHCGRCHATLREGAAVLELVIPNLQRTLVRCADCAGPAPPDLPPAIVSASIAERVAALSHVTTAAPDRTRGALTKFAQADAWTPHRND